MVSRKLTITGTAAACVACCAPLVIPLVWPALVAAGLVGIDGEMRALGLRPDGEAWTIAVEAPDPDSRAPHSSAGLEKLSGDAGVL